MRPLFHYIRRPLPGAGAENYAFVPDQMLPVQDMLGHSQWRVLSPLKVLQSPQIMINPMVPTSGYGGLVQGQVALQSLLQNPNNTPGG